MSVWPVAIPATVSEPAHSALSAQLRFDRLAGRSLPLDQIDAALAAGALAIHETRKAMRALRQVRQVAKAEKGRVLREIAKYARDEARLTAQREAQTSGERRAAGLGAMASAA